MDSVNNYFCHIPASYNLIIISTIKYIILLYFTSFFFCTKIEECQKLERIELKIEEVMKDQSDQKVEKWLREVEKTKKKCKEERGEI